MSTDSDGKPPQNEGARPDATQLADQRTTLAGARSFLANERTHLAYVRTAIALLGFGITLNRFSVFLTQEHKIEEHASIHGLYEVETVGIGMACSGLVVLAWSLYRFWRTHHDLERGTFKTPFASVVAMTLVLLALGGMSTIWLLRR